TLFRSNLDDGAVREHLAHACGEDFPFDAAVEIVAHEEAAAQQEFAQGAGLLIGEVPVANFDTIEKGPVVLIGIVQVDGLFDAAGMNSGEAADGYGQMPVAARVVHGPVGSSLFPGARELEAPVESADR